MFDEAHRIRAIVWCAQGREYLDGYHAIAHAHPGDLELPSVKFQVLGHGLECALKGWLVLEEGASSNALKSGKGYGGHDLTKLATAVARHYPPVQDEMAQITHLNASYWGGGMRDYEYPEGNKRIHFVPPNKLAAFLEQCLKDLSAAIRAR